MATQYTTILKLALPVQGELVGTWGDVVNNNITSMVEQAVAGKAVINSWTTNSHTLTSADGTTAESRCAILELTDSGTALSGAGTVVCPAASKIYIVDNNTAQIITVKTPSGTGVAIPVGKTMVVYCDGTNVVAGVTHAGSLSLGTSTVTASAILDEDDMVSNSATAMSTQQSIKAYVDGQVSAVDTLSAVLTSGNTSGSNNIEMGTVQKVQFRDAAIYLNSSVDGQLDIVADTEVQITAPAVTVNGNVSLLSQGDLRLEDASGGEYVALQAPTTIAASFTLTLPADDGDASQYLQTNGAGVLDWGTITDQTPSEIKIAYESNADTNAFTDTEQTKLTGIETGATTDQTPAEIKVSYESNADTNAFTDTEQTKLTGIETGATTDQTPAQIKVSYESNADTNAFTDAEQTKLAGLSSGSYNPWAVKTTTYTAVTGDQLICNNAVTAFTVTLPASPSAGNTVILSNAGAALVTVGRNGSNINSAASDGSLPTGNSTQLVYVDVTIGWKEL